MLFNTFEFAVFLVVVLGLYYCLTRKAQNVGLLLASYVFYGYWDWRFCALLLGSTVVDYTVARLMAAWPSKKKSLLMVSLGVNLGVLGFFKYFDFFVDSAIAMLSSLGLEANPALMGVLLPVGISFYTFQTLSYTIDVYRGRTTAERDPVTFALYVSYFPQLVAGPIERSTRLLPQLQKPRRVDGEAFSSGCLLILIGLFKKMAIADSVAPIVDEVFASSGSASGAYLLLGVVLFALQIYADFSGYTDIARGVSRLLGIELCVNFRQPYLASSITEFWRRWHISLSTWLRDYLYIPLGGNRKGRLNTYRNLMLTMLLGGLWHGAAWTFVAWGALHGLYLAAHKLWLRGREPAYYDPFASVGSFCKRLVFTACTFALVTLAWVYFRADGLAQANSIVWGIVTMRPGTGFVGVSGLAMLAMYASFMLLIDLPQALSARQEAMLGWPWPVRGGVAGVMVVLLLVMSPNDDTPFIYFQF